MLAVYSTVDDATVFLWCSRRTRPLSLHQQKYYRLDHLELAPTYRARAIYSLFGLAMVASRAIELGADGIVLSAFDLKGLHDFYVRAGATQAAPPGWNFSQHLVGFTFDRAALGILKGIADEREE